MANFFLKLADDAGNAGLWLDLEQLVVGANTVHRERHQVAGATQLEIAGVKAGDPTRDLYALLTRPINPQSTLFPYKGLDSTSRVARATPGSLRSLWAINLNSSNPPALRYLKAYDAAAGVDPAVAIPIALVPLVPWVASPIRFTNSALAAGLVLRATTGIADNDVGNPAANEIIVLCETGN